VPTGASTLLHSLAGILPVDHGTILCRIDQPSHGL